MSKLIDDSKTKSNKITFTITPRKAINLKNFNDAKWLKGVGFLPTDPFYTSWSETNIVDGNKVNSQVTWLDTLNSPTNPDENVKIHYRKAKEIDLGFFGIPTEAKLSNNENNNRSLYLQMLAPDITKDYFKTMKLKNLNTNESRYFLTKDASYGGPQPPYLAAFGTNISRINIQGAFWGWVLNDADDFMKTGDKMTLRLY